MGTARTIESYWLCDKRWRLEAVIEKAGHRWPKSARERRPRSAAEHGALVLAYLDSRNDPEGRFDGSDPTQIEDVEGAAHWTGEPGLLWRALVETGWIDVPPDGSPPRWHDYWTFNGRAIQARLNASIGGTASAKSRGGKFRTDDRTGGANQSTEPTPRTDASNGDPNRRPNANAQQSESGSVSEVRVRVLTPPTPPAGGRRRDSRRRGPESPPEVTACVLCGGSPLAPNRAVCVACAEPKVRTASCAPLPFPGRACSRPRQAPGAALAEDES